MERFNYPNLAAVEQEDARILQLLEAESWGRQRDEEEKLADQEKEMEDARLKAEANGQ